jgi:hypothetical protein
MIQMLNRCLLKLSVPELEYRKFISGCSYDGDEDENKLCRIHYLFYQIGILRQTWGQLLSNVIDYITITLQFS